MAVPSHGSIRAPLTAAPQLAASRLDAAHDGLADESIPSAEVADDDIPSAPVAHDDIPSAGVANADIRSAGATSNDTPHSLMPHTTAEGFLLQELEKARAALAHWHVQRQSTRPVLLAGIEVVDASIQWNVGFHERRVAALARALDEMRAAKRLDAVGSR